MPQTCTCGAIWANVASPIPGPRGLIDRSEATVLRSEVDDLRSHDGPHTRQFFELGGGGLVQAQLRTGSTGNQGTSPSGTAAASWTTRRR